MISQSLDHSPNNTNHDIDGYSRSSIHSNNDQKSQPSSSKNNSNLGITSAGLTISSPHNNHNNNHTKLLIHNDNSSRSQKPLKRNYFGKSHIINIHMRPDFEKILELGGSVLECFREFASSQHVLESLDCLLDIKKYKQMILKLQNENQQWDESRSSSSNTSANSDEIRLLNKVENDKVLNTSQLSEVNMLTPTTSSSPTSVTPQRSSVSTSTNSKHSKRPFLTENSNDRSSKEEHAFHFAHDILKKYIKEDSEYGINIDGLTRNNLLKHNLFSSVENFKQVGIYEWETALSIFNQVELQLILLLKSDVLPRFSQSEKWQHFVLQNGELADSCCYAEDLERVERLKFRKQDFMREYVSQKEIDFCEMAAGDMSCLQHMLGTIDLSVFISKGHQFVDSEDVGVGSFNFAKVVGFLPFSAEIVVSAQCSTFATKKFLPTTKYDALSEDGSEDPFLKNCEMIDPMTTNEKDAFPSWWVKFNIEYPNPFGMRTSYAAGSVFFVNGKYITVNKGILNPEKFPSIYTYLKKNGKLTSKKTTNALMTSIYVTTPVSRGRCHNVHFAIIHTSGVLLNFIAGRLYKHNISKIINQGQQTTIKEILELKKDRYQNIEDGYLRARKYLGLTLEKMGKRLETDCPFPSSFQQLQEFADME
ncbi:hypothetical protein C9374_012680 [Naegleria lovaniensis]|uniref:RGS domain-containing protein n=1 Tax=Naegleria lovaniensis TaxID=51637 RepID=A0AA88H083_NAELO|nr:uncharacterized protein C9374_012680 [Naegleria lovaniensis]KAG2392428.1 hypothetical protein C9374_012680 [Naegleria lovaniensis]